MKIFKKKWFLILCIVGGLATVALFLVYQAYLSPSGRTRKVIDFLTDPATSDEPQFEALSQCGDAPFQMPTSGMIGFIWDDSFRPGHRHTGH